MYNGFHRQQHYFPLERQFIKLLDYQIPLFADSSSTIKIQSKEAQYLKEIDLYLGRSANKDRE